MVSYEVRLKAQGERCSVHFRTQVDHVVQGRTPRRSEITVWYYSSTRTTAIHTTLCPAQRTVPT